MKEIGLFLLKRKDAFFVLGEDFRELCIICTVRVYAQVHVSFILLPPQTVMWLASQGLCNAVALFIELPVCWYRWCILCWALGGPSSPFLFWCTPGISLSWWVPNWVVKKTLERLCSKAFSETMGDRHVSPVHSSSADQFHHSLFSHFASLGSHNWIPAFWPPGRIRY